MKFLHFAAALYGTLSASSALEDSVAPRDIIFPALTTKTLYATSVFTVVKCDPDNTNCPEEATAVVTQVVPLTTTICPFTSDASSLTISIPTGRQTPPTSPEDPGTPPSFPTSFPTSTFVSFSTVLVTPVPSTSGSEYDPTTGSTSSELATSYDPTDPSVTAPSSLGLTSTNSDSVGTSFKPSQSYDTPPTGSPGSSGGPTDSATDAVPTSLRTSGQPTLPVPSLSFPSSSVAYAPPPGPSTGGSTSTEGTWTSIKPSSSLDQTITHVTSILTLTLTSVVTAPKSLSTSNVDGPTTSSATAIPSLSYSTDVPALPTGPSIPANETITPSTKDQGQPTAPGGTSGYPQSSQNGTWPSPTVPSLPENAGTRLVGKSSTMAVVLALAFALDNPWISLVLGIDAVAAAGEEKSGWVVGQAPNGLLKAEQIFVTLLGFAALIHFLKYVKYSAVKAIIPPHKEEIDRMLAERADDEGELEYYCELHEKIIKRSIAVDPQ